MSTAAVQAFLDASHTDLHAVEVDEDASTVQSAAAALGVQPAQIAKTLAVRVPDGVVLVVMRGDARLDNARFRQRFGVKPRMVPAAQVEELTGQPVGGVSPFGHEESVPVFCDESLRDFDVVYPSGGSPTSVVRVATEQLALVAHASWVDVARRPGQQAGGHPTGAAAAAPVEGLTEGPAQH